MFSKIATSTSRSSGRSTGIFGSVCLEENEFNAAKQADKSSPLAVFMISNILPILFGKLAVFPYSAKEVKKGGVKDTDFLQPTDYKEITKDELQKMFGGAGEEE